MKSDKSKYYDITYIQNLKNTTNELAKQKQTHRKKQTNKKKPMATKEERGRNKLGVCD